MFRLFPPNKADYIQQYLLHFLSTVGHWAKSRLTLLQRRCVSSQHIMANTHLDAKWRQAAVEQFISCSWCRMNIISSARASRGFGRYSGLPLLHRLYVSSSAGQRQHVGRQVASFLIPGVPRISPQAYRSSTNPNGRRTQSQACTATNQAQAQADAPPSPSLCNHAHLSNMYRKFSAKPRRWLGRAAVRPVDLW